MTQEHDPLEDAIAKMQQSWTQVQPTASEELDEATFLATVKEQMPERQRISDDAWEIAHRVARAVSDRMRWPMVLDSEWTEPRPNPHVCRWFRAALPSEAPTISERSGFNVGLSPLFPGYDSLDSFNESLEIPPFLFVSIGGDETDTIYLDLFDPAEFEKELLELIPSLYQKFLESGWSDAQRVANWSYTLEQFVASLPKGFGAEQKIKGARNLEVTQDDLGVTIEDESRGFSIRVPFKAEALAKGAQSWTRTRRDSEIGLDWARWAPLDEEGKVPVKWARKINDHLAVEAHAWADDAYLVIVRGGNRLRVDLDEAKALIEVLADEAARLAGVVAGDVEPGGGGNGGN